MSAARVALLIPTYRRPAGLERALRGLAAQRFRRVPPPDVAVHVVDNEAGGPMAGLVAELAPLLPWPVRHHCEPARGVASCRNRCLDLVAPEDDFAVFLDDDEVPRPDWLDALLATATATGAEIVQGPVISHYTDPVPAWFAEGRFLQLGPFEEAETLRYGYSGNVCIRADVLRRLRPRFDERFNATGGEDQHFFIVLMRAGCRIVTSAEAIADEWVPGSRTTLGYMLKRRYRVGATLALADVIEDRRPAVLLRRGALAAGSLFAGLMQLPLAAFRGRAAAAERLGRAAYGIGQWGGLLGLVHREYDVIHGAGPAPAVPSAEERRT